MQEFSQAVFADSDWDDGVAVEDADAGGGRIAGDEFDELHGVDLTGGRRKACAYSVVENGVAVNRLVKERAQANGRRVPKKMRLAILPIWLRSAVRTGNICHSGRE